MRTFFKSSIFIVLIALFVGGYIYLRHGGDVHRLMVGGGAGHKVRASEDFVTYFGQVPEVPMVGCEGIVILYPSKDGGSLVPVPFFITTSEKKGELIARTVLSDLPVPAMNDFVRPFIFGGGEVESVVGEGDTVSLRVRLQKSATERDLQVAARSFLMAYSQVTPEVARVFLDAGSGLRVEEEMRASWSDQITVRDPGKPVLLDAFLVSKREGEDPTELRVIFDRPVAITSFAVEGPEGEKIPGKLYRSEFAMAGIFRTVGPIEIGTGEGFSLIYRINDFRGRHNEGRKSYAARFGHLAGKEHFFKRFSSER